MAMAKMRRVWTLRLLWLMAIVLALTVSGPMASRVLADNPGSETAFPADPFALPIPDSNETAQSPCGAEGQRACSIFDTGQTVGCQSGLQERLGCPNCDNGSIGTCVRITPCGGENQRACTLSDLVGGGCKAEPAGLVEIAGCSPEKECYGTANTISSGMCVIASSCGGRGQRACTTSEKVGGGCNAGLVEVAGCSGDCFGKTFVSGGMCTDPQVATMDEPTTNATPLNEVPTIGSCSLSGYMDMHMHMFADQAHGGGTLAGKPYDPANGVNTALRPDFTTDQDLVYGNGLELGVWSSAVDVVQTDGSFLADVLQALRISISTWITGFAGCPSAFSSTCGSQDYLHGPHDPLLGDPIGSFLGTQDGAGSNFGAPLFNGWPKWTSTTHQQVYYKWLERAWQGGLRMMTELAVTNEALCKGNKHLKGVDCENSMLAIDAQLDAARDFETYIDNLSGGPGKGWYRIVRTPLEARVAIASGKLAVVLGIETAELFNCYERSLEDGSCTEQYVRNKVDEYYDKGVRVVFPIHNFDNAFGAAATWQDGIEVGQRVVEGRWWEVRDCRPDGYTFKLGDFTQTLLTLLKFSGVVDPDSVPVDRPGNGHCNAKGMEGLGEVLIDALMDKGMIIDVDHMSVLALDRTLALAEARSYTGIVASHVLPLALHGDIVVGDGPFAELKSTRHERLRTGEQMARIRNLGGMIAAMLKDDGQDTALKGEKYTTGYGLVQDDCRHSSKSFAQAYQYAVDQMDGPVAIGSDFNGVAGHVGPRFGVEACGSNIAERNEQLRRSKKVTYPFTNAFGTFDRQVTGQRSFDYNFDGMAHVGMLPDFIEDLEAIELPPRYMDSLFRSAEGYVRMWEGATASTPSAADDTPQAVIDNTCAYVFTPSPPTVTAVVTPPANSAGWHNTPATVTWVVSASPASPVLEQNGCDTVKVSTDASGRTLTCEASSAAGPAKATVIIRLDQVAPTVLFGEENPPANVNGWRRDNVSVAYSLTDDRSGLPAGTATTGSLVFAGEGQGLTQGVTVVDVAGNSATVSSPAVNIDKTAPLLAVQRLTPANAFGWNNGPVTVRFTASDGLSGLLSAATSEFVFTTEGADQSVQRGAVDLAGNITLRSIGGINIDLTAPTVNGGRVPDANAFGWNNQDVTAQFTCSDQLSGIDTCSPESSVTTEGANQSRIGMGRDRAGNTASASVSGISIDKTPPTIDGAPDRTPNAAGWYNADVTINFTCQDGLSGINTCGPSQTISTDAVNLSRSGTALDKAGNSAVAAVGGINLDKTPPSLTCTNSAPQLWPPDHKMVPIAITVLVADAWSTDLGFVLTAATSDEADNGLGDGDQADDIQGFTIGGASVTGALRAERSGRGDGRTYALTYQSVDAAGNTGTCLTTVTVPRSSNR